MKTETKNELRKQLKTALSKNRRLEKEISQIQNLGMPERLCLMPSQVCDVLDAIDHAHRSLREDARNMEGEKKIVSDDSLIAIYQKECRLDDLMKGIKDQCLSGYEFSSELQTHEAVFKDEDEDSEATND